MRSTAAQWGQRLTLGGNSLPNEGSATSVFSPGQISPEPRVVSVFLERSAFSAPGLNVSIRARVIWGAGGASESFLCDWGEGVGITLVANELRVDAVSGRPDPTVPYSAGNLGVTLTAAVGWGGLSNEHPVLTQPLPLLPPGNTSTPVTPPAMARRVGLILFNEGPGVVDPYTTTSLRLALPSSVPIALLPAAGISTSFGATLPNDCNVAVRNTSLVDTLRASLLWYLST